MLELILILPYLGALIGAAVYAFLRPQGVYWRSAAGFGIVAVLARLFWRLSAQAAPQETGFGAFGLWFGVTGLAALLAITACAAATLRHLLNALGARMIA